MTRWERYVPVYGVPVFNRVFLALCALIAAGLGLTVYREIVGLGALSGMSDPFGWGLWKTFNVMVLTGLGSGGFSVGIAAFVFNNKKLHSVMRVALLTNLLAYASGMIMLGVDAGRPWNFYRIIFPWNWNLDSPLLEVAVCMSVYATIPLFLENLPPLFEYAIYRLPHYRKLAERLEQVMKKSYPFTIGLAYILPMMHQSSLGALMILGGDRVNTLWQTPWLPVIYVWAAAFMGFNCVVLCLLLSRLVYKRELDGSVMLELNRLTVWVVNGWVAFRLADVIGRDQMAHLFTDPYALLFWLEIGLTAGAAWVLTTNRAKKLGTMFWAHLCCALGGVIYRFSPTMLAFHAKDGATYFPSVLEIVVCLAYVAMAVAAYLVAVKKLAILPGNNEDWRKMAQYEETVNPGIQWTGYAAAKH